MKPETIRALEKIARIDFTSCTEGEMVCLYNGYKTAEAYAKAAINMYPFECDETLILRKEKFDLIFGV